jgi:hypothetical protein
MMVLLLACIAAGCTSAWIVYMLFGPVPSPRRPLLIPRVFSEAPITAQPADATSDPWLEAPTLAQVVTREERPIAAPIVHRPRFVAPQIFDLVECTRLDP